LQRSFNGLFVSRESERMDSIEEGKSIGKCASLVWFPVREERKCNYYWGPRPKLFPSICGKKVESWDIIFKMSKLPSLKTCILQHSSAYFLLFPSFLSFLLCFFILFAKRQGMPSFYSFGYTTRYLFSFNTFFYAFIYLLLFCTNVLFNTPYIYW
jgi:hypothetical protein